MAKNTRAWLEINLDAIAQNMREIRRVTNPGAEVMGVVKADAYGHGAVAIARCILKNGASRLAVSQMDEAIQLRKNGIQAPILLLSDLESERMAELLQYDITQLVYTRAFAEQLSAYASSTGETIRIHIKLDTGMGRVGFAAERPETVSEIARIAQMPGLCVEGIFTHFAVSDELGAADAYTEKQFELFNGVCERLKQQNITIPIRHVANSAAILRFPGMHLEMVRAGIILYGFYPSGALDGCGVRLCPAMSFKARLTAVKKVPAGTFLSYGCTYKTERESIIATVPVGYADGYFRAMSNRGRVLIHGRYAPICGRVCMDQMMIDVTDLDSAVSVGDEVVLIGRQGEGEISAEEVASLCNTIHYEVICSPSKRVPRHYLQNGKTVEIVNELIK